MKKAISILLTVMMLFSIAPMGGLAGLGFTPRAKAANTEFKTGDIIEFGKFPQQEITDTDLINELNALSLDWESLNWFSGNGSEGSAKPGDFGKYADVVYKGSEYRCLYFTEYRPLRITNKTSDNEVQRENGYYSNTPYWFKISPIRWIILNVNTGLIISESVLYSLSFASYQRSYMSSVASDYKESYLRQWLNNDFFSLAFNDNQGQMIKKTLLPECNLQDSVFIITNTEKDQFYAYGTDYAKACGLWVDKNKSSAWFLRADTTDFFIRIAGYDGYNYAGAINSHWGVRPAMCVDLDAICFPSGYSFNTDRWNFHNFRRTPTEKQFTRLFTPAKAHLLYLSNLDYGTGGNCYGMALTTIALMNDSPSPQMFKKNDSTTDQKRNESIVQINRSSTEWSTSETEKNDDFISCEGNNYPVSEFINYAHLTMLASETVEKDRYNVAGVYHAVEEYMNGKRSTPPIIIIAKDKKGTECHAILGIGIKDNKIIINDCNHESEQTLLELKRTDGQFTGEWSYLDYHGDNTERFGMIEWTDSSTYHFPFEALQNDVYLESTRDLSQGEEIDYNLQLLKLRSTQNVLLTSNTTEFKTDHVKKTIKLGRPNNSTVFENTQDSFVYWLDDKDINSVSISDIAVDNAQFMLSDNYSATGASIGKSNTVCLTANDNGLNAVSISGAKDDMAEMYFLTANQPEQSNLVLIKGSISESFAEATETNDGRIVVTGLNNITAFLKDNDGKVISEANAYVNDGASVHILVDNNEKTITAQISTTETTTEEQNVQHSSICKYCGKTHSGFGGSIILFFHEIAYFFAHLFGKM